MINRTLLIFFWGMTLLSFVSYADEQQITTKTKQQKRVIEEKVQKESRHKSAIKYNLPIISPPKLSKAGGTRAPELNK